MPTYGLNPITDLAQKRADGEKAKSEEKAKGRAEAMKRAVPIVALVIANVIFVSLDIRAFDVVYKMTGETLLAGATVIVSGILALLWWDLLYPHSRKHSNDTQVKLSGWGVFLGIGLSAVLAFLDYIVGNVKLSEGFLWGVVIAMTAAQGILLGVWWLKDNSIVAKAEREKSVAGRSDLSDSVQDVLAEIAALKEIGSQLNGIVAEFGSPAAAAKALRAMGFGTLARMVEDDDGDGTMNYKDPDWKGSIGTGATREARELTRRPLPTQKPTE